MNVCLRVNYYSQLLFVCLRVTVECRRDVPAGRARLHCAVECEVSGAAGGPEKTDWRCWIAVWMNEDLHAGIIVWHVLGLAVRHSAVIHIFVVEVVVKLWWSTTEIRKLCQSMCGIETIATAIEGGYHHSGSVNTCMFCVWCDVKYALFTLC